MNDCDESTEFVLTCEDIYNTPLMSSTIALPVTDCHMADNLSKVDGVLSDLSEALADVALELSVGVRNEGSQVRNSTLVDDGLGELLSVLGNLTKSGGGDALQSKLGLLDAKDEEADGTGVNDGLGQLTVVLGDAGEGKSSGLLH